MNLTVKKLNVRIYSLLLFSSYLLFSYYVFNGWWYSSIGTLLIVFFSYLIWKEKFPDATGLRLSLTTVIKTLVVAIIIVCCSILIIKYVGSKHGINIQYSGLRNYYHDVFYILNEEIILGGIAIYLLTNRYRLTPLLASTVLAIAFAMVHFVFYKWVFLETGTIKPVTLTVLFMVGFVRNNLIINYRHIGYSWALHFGWMAIMFGSNPYRVDTGVQLTEPEKFNMFLGSQEMLVISCILATVSFLQLIRKGKTKKV